ncbi:MAG: metallophosphoesterase [Halarcobacter sp.]
MKIPKLSKIKVYVNHEDLQGLKILHLSDLHINKKTDILSIKILVDYCKGFKYDFIVITGDIIDCKTNLIKDKLYLLNKLAKNKKVFYISGNHDLVYGLKDLEKSLPDFILLDNKQNLIKFNNKQINLVGISDRFSKFFNIKRDEKKVLEYLNSSDATIFIAHQPKDYKLALDSCELFLCGHTHGGQIFPFHYFVKLFQPFLAGIHYVNKTAIYINKGLGTWGIDFRYKANAEITLLKLISKSVE